MRKPISRFFQEEKGQGMTEYGLILGVIAIGAVTAFGLFGNELVTKINTVKSNIFTTTP